jgi:hypothetical protein
MIEPYTNFPRFRKRSLAAACGPSLHIPQCSIIPALGVIAAMESGRHQLRAGPTLYPAVLAEVPRPDHRENRAAQALMPPLRLMNCTRGSESSLCAAAYRRTRDHLLLVRLSALAGSAVHRMTAANGSFRSDTFSRCKRSARRARSRSQTADASSCTAAPPRRG